MKIRKKMALGLSLCYLVMFSFALFVWGSFHTTSVNAKELLKATHEHEMVSRMRQAVLNQVSSFHSILQHPQESLHRSEAHVLDLGLALQDVKSLKLEGESAKLFKQIQRTQDRLTELLAQIRQSRQSLDSHLLDATFIKSVEGHLDILIKTSSDLFKRVKADLDQSFQSNNRIYEQILWQLLGVFAFITLLFFGFSYSLYKSLTTPIKQLLAATKRIAGGDLLYKVMLHSRDEFEELARSFNSMNQRTKKLYLQKNESSLTEHTERIVAKIAYDFNNALTAVMGYASLLQTQLQNVTELEKVEKILSAAENGYEINKRLSHYYKSNGGEKGRVLLPEVLHDALGILRRSAGSGIQIKCQIKGGLPAIEAVHITVMNVILNLGYNSLKAIAPKGVLEFKAKKRVIGPDDDLVKWLTPWPYVWLVISDSGEGMPLFAVEELMGMEPKAVATPSKNTKGLGLTMVREDMLAIGGHVLVDTKSGQGTQIHLFFRAFNQQDNILVETTLPPESDIIQCSEVVVVDSDVLVSGFIFEVLAQQQISVHVFQNGESLLQNMDHFSKVEVVFLDRVLPDYSGITLAQELLKLPQIKRLVFISGQPAEFDTEWQELSQAEPRCTWLQKPFTIEDLKGALQNLVNKSVES